ncbi:MAG TPA: HdeD family acid-resistance protein [Devosiaceae bacterium]
MMTTRDNSALFEKFTHNVRRKWGWFLVLGIIYVLGGLAAIFLPVMSTLAFTLVIGVSLIISGIVQIAHGFQMRDWQGVTWHIVMGLVTLVGGALAVWNPISGAIAITLVIAITFLVQGITEVMQGFRVRPLDGWGWMVGAGILAILAGLALMFSFPVSGLVTLGTLAGVAMLATGFTYIYIAMSARTLWKNMGEDVRGAARA